LICVYLTQTRYVSCFCSVAINLPKIKLGQYMFLTNEIVIVWSVQGYVDEDADPNPFSGWFGGGKKKCDAGEAEVQAKEEPPAEEPKKGFWPF